MICVSIGEGSPAEAKKVLRDTGFIELRADLLDWTLSEYKDVISSGNKSIFTFRPGALSDQERIRSFEAAASAGAAYLDVEIESGSAFLEEIRKIVNASRAELIISYHNYELTPSQETLETVLSDCYLSGADVAKIACRVYSPADSARLLSLYSVPGRKVVIGMGNAGKITRIAGSFLGAEFTFASPGNGGSTAEGQLSFKEMKDIIKKIQ